MNWLKQISQSRATTSSSPPTTTRTTSAPTGQRQQPGKANAAYTARLQALANYYRLRSARGVAAVRLLDTQRVGPLASAPSDKANAAYTARLQALANYYGKANAAYTARLQALANYYMSLDEYMRRVNARRLYGMPVFMPTQQGGGGGGGGGAAPGSLPSWIENFLNQVTWRI